MNTAALATLSLLWILPGFGQHASEVNRTDLTGKDVDPIALKALRAATDPLPTAQSYSFRAPCQQRKPVAVRRSVRPELSSTPAAASTIALPSGRDACLSGCATSLAARQSAEGLEVFQTIAASIALTVESARALVCCLWCS